MTNSPSLDDLLVATENFRKSGGTTKALRHVYETVCGRPVYEESEVDVSDRPAVIAALDKEAPAEKSFVVNGELDTGAIMARFNSSGRRGKPVTE